MQSFLQLLWGQLEEDGSLVCTLLHSELEVTRLAVERSVVSQIYDAAMHPNGRADVSRDEVLAEHIRLLAAEVTPSHPRYYTYSPLLAIQYSRHIRQRK